MIFDSNGFISDNGQTFWKVFKDEDQKGIVVCLDLV